MTQPAEYLIELQPAFCPRPGITHVVFDFDGTLSWLRHGWPLQMADMFLEYLPLKAGEKKETVRDLLLDELLSLNGKPTVFQMIRFCERLKRDGVVPPEAEVLRAEYQRRLDERIAFRSRQIETGEVAPEAFVIHGARTLLEALKRRGLTLVILSGTPEPHVRHEARQLRLHHYFGDHIHGPRGDVTRFSKMDVLEELLESERIEGSHLLSFGDGPVEIRFTKELGGLAVAVCSDEEVNGSGRVDPHKRKQLLLAGADAVIADYRNPEVLIQTLFGR